MDRETFKAQARKLGVPEEQLGRFTRPEFYLNIPNGFNLKRRHFEFMAAGLFIPQTPDSPKPAPRPAQPMTRYAQSTGTPSGLQVVQEQPTPPQQSVAPQVITKKKKKSNGGNSILYAICAVVVTIVAIFLILQIPGVSEKLNFSLPGVQASLTCEEGIKSSTMLRLHNAPINGNDFVQPEKIPTLKSDPSCIYFDGAAMAATLEQQIVLTSTTTKIDTPYTGAQIIAGNIAKATAAELHKETDKEWINSIYAQILAVLDKTNFKTIGKFNYLILPGYTVPLPTPTLGPTELVIPTQPENSGADNPTPVVELQTPTNTAEPTQIPTPTTLPTDQPTPTNVPRPTLQSFVEQAKKFSSDTMKKYNQTPVPDPATPPAQNPTVTLAYYLTILRGNACSPIRFVFSTYAEHESIDGGVLMYMGTSCMDGDGIPYTVMIPLDIASRHIMNSAFPQIWITKYPNSTTHGPALDIGNGYFIQPFQ